MAYKSGHDTILFGTSAARNGLTEVPVAAGFTEWPANGAAGVGTQVFAKEDCKITRAGLMTEAIANIIAGADGYRWHKTTDADWNRSEGFMTDQTVDWQVEGLMAAVTYPLLKGEALVVEVDNNNNAQGDWPIFNVDVGSKGARVHAGPFPGIPDNARWHKFDSANNSVADTVTRIGLTPVSFNLNREAVYRVYGARVQSASGLAFRLVALDSDDRPGGPMCDTMVIGKAVYFAPFGVEVNGLQGFWGDILSFGAEASNWDLLIARVK